MSRVLLIFGLCVVMVTSQSLGEEPEGGGTAANDDENAALREEFEKLKQQHVAEIAELKRRIEELERDKVTTEVLEEDELATLRGLAETEAAKVEEKEKEPLETVFKSGGLSLQALNPEISVTGDMLALYRDQEGTRERSDFDFRTLGIHIESYLDPYTRFKSAVPVTESFSKLGEAYMTRFGLLPDVNLTLGKFRQQFGVVNRWHRHGLDQVDFPLALRSIFGDGGLNQTGVSLDWTMPSFRETAQQLTLQVTDGQNEQLFDENSRNTPSVLMHYKNYRDLSKDTYLELGLTSLVGWNDGWQVLAEDGSWRTERDRLETWVLGGDFTVRWEPTERMRYRNLEWRSEAYYLDRGILGPYDLDRDTVNAWGTYSYVQTKLTRTWDVGIRFDYYKPDSKDYAGLSEISLSPLAVEDDDAYRWQVGPYVTWFQSPFVKFRLEYNHGDGEGMQEPEDVVFFQMIFSAGPHKHERY